MDVDSILIVYHVIATFVLLIMFGREDPNAKLGLLIYICINMVLHKSGE